MTDDQIRASLKWDKEHQHGGRSTLTAEEGIDLMTELLAYRELHRAIKWAVWVADQSADSGWTAQGWFPDKTSAHLLKERIQNYAGLYEPVKVLVLPANEVPCLTAR